MTLAKSHRAIMKTCAVALAALPLLAQAHTGADAGAHHGFFSGFTHPFTGLDHLAAMLAVGLWSALTARSARWQDAAGAPFAFATLLLVGALLGLAGLTLPAVEPMIAASLLVLGLLVATRRGLPTLAGAALVGAFALFHGAAHGNELSGTAALVGMVLATALLHGAGMALGFAVRRHSRWWPRVAGFGVAAFGAALLVA